MANLFQLTLQNLRLINAISSVRSTTELKQNSQKNSTNKVKNRIRDIIDIVLLFHF
jgi:hypothetical protein